MNLTIYFTSVFGLFSKILIWILYPLSLSQFNKLQIGFLSEKTQESCSKDARSLLSNLTSKYPTLLSDILQKLKDNFVSVGKVQVIFMYYIWLVFMINLTINSNA